MSIRSITKSVPAYAAIWTLILGAVAFILSGGKWNLFVAAWIWPFAFLYYSRRTKSIKQFFVLAAVIAAGQVIKWMNVLAAGYFLDAL